MSKLYPDIPSNLQYYINRIRQVRRAPWHGGWAPQKPVLIWTLLDLIDKGVVQENRFPMDEILFGTFRHFWRVLVPEDNFNIDKILRPLFHLQNDGFWQLIDVHNQSPEKFISGKGHFQNRIRYGRLNDRLFKMLKERPEYLKLMRLVIADYFFPHKLKNLFEDHDTSLLFQLTDLEAEVLLEPKVKYGKRTYHYEGFLRTLAFRRAVLTQYQYTCCISGLRINKEVPMVEAAHIIPHADTGNNTITNGLALCPNLHTAFDYGLIGLDDKYRVLIRKGLKENASPYNLRQFEGKLILLPELSSFHPLLQNLRQHRKQFLL